MTDRKLGPARRSSIFGRRALPQPLVVYPRIRAGAHWRNHAWQVFAARSPRRSADGEDRDQRPTGGLARRVARGDRSALAGPHDTLAPEVLRATFVEVWRMARSLAGSTSSPSTRHNDLELDRLLDIPNGRGTLSASSRH